MKRNDVVKLLKEMNQTEMHLFNFMKEQGRDAEAKAHLQASMAFDSAIWLLTDKKYAADIAAIYQDVEG